MTPIRMRSLAGLVLVSTVVLTGCGSTPDFNPGVAARVGDETVSSSDVRDLAADYCSAAETQLGDQALANHYLNGRVAGALALRSAADQALASYGVPQDPSYDAAVEQGKKSDSIASLTDAQAEALIEVQGSEIYVSAAELAIGKKVLGGSPSDEDATAAGQKAFIAWLDDNDVQIDPKYGVEITKDQSVLADTGVSFPVSDTATTADNSQPDSAAAALLPETQRCG